MLRMILNRLREPSSLAGLSVLGVLFGVDPEKANVVVQALGAVLAAGAVLLPESRK
jgi:hypothetical protein